MKHRYSIIVLFGLLNIFCFTLLRVAFLFKSWGDMPHGFGDLLGVFGFGLLYDLVFNTYFYLPFLFVLAILPEKIFHSKIMKVFFGFVFFALIYGLLFVLAAEWLFWEEFSVRFNFISVDYLIYRREVTDNIKESYPIFWVLSALALVDLMICYPLRNHLKTWLSSTTKLGPRLRWAFALMLIPVLGYFAIGQDLRDHPENNYLRELRSNGPYQFVAAFNNNSLDYNTFYALADNQVASDHLKKNYGKGPSDGGLFDISRFIKAQEKPKGTNVIMISVESLSGEYLKRYGNTEGITPFLDELAKSSLCFDQMYATGTRTTRGLESLTLSLPPTPGHAIVKRPNNAGMYNFGTVLKENGYDAYFLYSGLGYFENMNEFFSGCGYKTIDQLDFKDTEKTFSNAWGVCDEDLYRKAISVADEISANEKPFFFHIMTTSNHRPYTYPEGKIDIPSGTGRSGAVKYTDYSIKVLLEESAKKAWFDNTIFVIIADHCAGSAGKVGLPINQYHIPMIIYSHKLIAPKIIDKVCSQIDVAPTVLELVGISYESHFFGKNVLAEDYVPRAFIGNYQKLGLYANNKLVLLEPVKKAFLHNDPYHNDALSPLAENSSDMLELQSYYQGANYLLIHRLLHQKNTDQYSLHP